MKFKDWRRLLKTWMPPLIGISVMLLLGYWFEVAWFFLFTHHLFWVIGVFLLINPMAETFWPSAAPERKGRPKPQPSARARQRREAHQRLAQSKGSSETPMERLARLRKLKEGVERQIERLTQERMK
jgi:hypothetical protein